MSAKNYDNHNRWRNKTVAIRMSPEEAEQLDKFVKLSGYTKQDYLIKRALQQEIKVVGNPRVYKALKNQMEEIYSELKRFEKCEDITEEFLDVLDYIATLLDGLKGDDAIGG